MSNADENAPELAESARVGHSGPPQRHETGGPQPAPAAPSPEDLDEREDRFTRPRKPMGPGRGGPAPTEPRPAPDN